MARKCSHCGNYGHNSRTCGLGLGLGHREIMLCEGGDDNNGRSGLRLFGVQVRIGGGGGAGSASMKKSYSMDCLQLAAPHACSSLVSSPSSSSLCSSSSPSSLLLSIDDGLQRGAADGYLSDGPHGRAVQERKKGTSRNFFPFLMKRQKRKICSLEIQKLHLTRISFLIGNTYCPSVV
jgi:hypothetical protein